MPTSADLLLDTSAAVARLSEDHPAHEAVREACRGRIVGLAGHAIVETYSVLTRLPGVNRVTAANADRMITTAFTASVALPADASLAAVAKFALAGVAGGSVYDGLVGLAARHAGIPLLSRDRRAAATYAKLGVEFRLL